VAAAPSVVAVVRRSLAADPRVVEVIEVLTLHLGPQEILVGVTINFDDALPGGAVETAAYELSQRIQEVQPDITRLFLRPGDKRQSRPSFG
jgi:divalent metal cation (Fe/Co/Zn/Cd) transporter